MWLIMTIVNIASQQLVNKTSISPELLTHTGSYTQLWLFFFSCTDTNSRSRRLDLPELYRPRNFPKIIQP